MSHNQKGFSAPAFCLIAMLWGIVMLLLLMPTASEKRRDVLVKTPVAAHTVFRNVGDGFAANLVRSDNTPDLDRLCFVAQGANLELLQVVRTHKGVQGAYFSGGCRDGGNIFVPVRYFGRLQTLNSIRNQAPNDIPPLRPADTLPPLEQ